MDEKKVREAIKALKITIDIGKQKIEYNKTFEPKNDNEPIEKSIEHAKTAIEALEKQLPKKVECEDGFSNNGFARIPVEERLPGKTPNSCRLIREMGEPGKDGNGKCMGFTRNFTDDEPCEICKKCEWCTAREEGD